MNELILVIEDENKIARISRDYLEKSNYQVIISNDGKTGLHAFRKENPALIILDLNLPVIDGLEVCRTIRKESDVPIIMVTARSDETDKLIGLEIGADDYITKPFSPKELVARVRVVLRRANPSIRQADKIIISDLVLDKLGHQLSRNGEKIDLSRTEFQLLTNFMEHPGQSLSRAQLLLNIHGHSQISVDRSIDAHIKNLRKKLEIDPANPIYILTVFGIGYKFNGELK